VLEDHLDPSVDEGQFDFTEAAAYTAKLAAEFGHEILRVAVRFERNLENRDLANKVGG
jgi:hypothetical protein